MTPRLGLLRYPYQSESRPQKASEVAMLQQCLTQCNAVPLCDRINASVAMQPLKVLKYSLSGLK